MSDTILIKPELVSGLTTTRRLRSSLLAIKHVCEVLSHRVFILDPDPDVQFRGHPVNELINYKPNKYLNACVHWTSTPTLYSNVSFLRLSDVDQEAIIAHELGHIYHGHNGSQRTIQNECEADNFAARLGYSCVLAALAHFHQWDAGNPAMESARRDSLFKYFVDGPFVLGKV